MMNQERGELNSLVPHFFKENKKTKQKQKQKRKLLFCKLEQLFKQRK